MPIVLHLFVNKLAYDLIEVHHLRLRRRRLSERERIVENPPALFHQMPQSSQLLQHARVRLRERQLQIIRDRLHGAERLTQFMRQVVK